MATAESFGMAEENTGENRTGDAAVTNVGAM